MTQVGKNRGSFGFANINGKALKLTVGKRVGGSVMDKKLPKKMMNKIRVMMDRAGRKGRKEAKLVRHTPKLTGRLIKSIYWRKARITQDGNIIRGSLRADTPYAQLQEFEHKTKSRFLQRAIWDIAEPDFQRRLKENKLIFKRLFLGHFGFD